MTSMLVNAGKVCLFFVVLFQINTTFWVICLYYHTLCMLLSKKDESDEVNGYVAMRVMVTHLIVVP